LFGRWWNEENFRCRRFFERGRGFRRADDAVGDERGLALGFVGVDAVVDCVSIRIFRSTRDFVGGDYRAIANSLDRFQGFSSKQR